MVECVRKGLNGESLGLSSSQNQTQKIPKKIVTDYLLKKKFQKSGEIRGFNPGFVFFSGLHKGDTVVRRRIKSNRSSLKTGQPARMAHRDIPSLRS